MSQMIEINLRPDARTLRQFGYIALAGFGFLAVIAWQEWLIFAFGLGAAREPLALGFGTIGAVSLIFSLVYPKANLPIYLALTIIAFPIGFVLSYVIMGTLFYLIIGPIGLVMRLSGSDLLNLRFDRSAETYWVDARPQRPNESYFKQF